MADAWSELKAKVKAKRLKKCTTKDVPCKRIKLQGNNLTVQRLSSNVSGKAQKYTRMGPREFVPFNDNYDELTVANIKLACEKHYSVGNLMCDVVAGEQGPSCETIDQIPDINKVIYVRFVPSSSPDDTIYIPTDSNKVQTVDLSSEPRQVSTCSAPIQAPTSITSTPTKSVLYPKSLSVVDMINLGKINSRSSPTSVSIYKYHMDHFSWSNVPTVVEFFEERQAFGTGGFRKAYKATSRHTGFENMTYVIKRYHPEALRGISETGQTPQTHTKKVVQMHMLARNFAPQLAKKVSPQSEAFGNALQYSPIYYGETDKKEYVTIEEFLEGEFVKYTNNTGLLCVGEDSELGQKAECLSHFSFEKSQKKLLLVDIQGNDFQCFDPEIASSDLYDGGDILYCTGNLSDVAIQNFVNSHKCNKYCVIAGLNILD